MDGDWNSVLQKFYNGSLSPASQLPYRGTYPNNDQEQHMNLTILPNNMIQMVFPYTNGSIITALPLAASLFDTTLSRYPILCVSPISGQYSGLGRCFFYLSLFSSFVVRNHSALATAALGTAMLYAATTAIHGFALLVIYYRTQPESLYGEPSQRYLDPDVEYVRFILVVATISLTPILNWSVTIRRHRANCIIVLWGFLVVSALLPISVLWLAPFHNGLPNTDWHEKYFLSFALCGTQGDCGHLPPGLTKETYSRCNCVDFCSAFPSKAPLRSGQQLVAMVDPHNYSFNAGPWVFFELTAGYISYIAAFHGILGLLHSQFSNTEVRNLAFRIINIDLETLCILLYLMGLPVRSHPNSTRAVKSKILQTTFIIFRKLQYLLAKTLTTISFLFAITIMILSPILFPWVILSSEIFLWDFRLAEQNDSVSVWSVWVSAGLSIMAALVLYFRARFEHAILALFGVENCSTDHNNSSDKAQTGFTRSMMITIIAPLHHSWYILSYMIAAAHATVAEFRVWFRDPIPRSYDKYYHTRAQWEHLYPQCRCCYCTSLIASSDSTSKVDPWKNEYHTLAMRLIEVLESKVRARREYLSNLDQSNI